jgi:hypothetical protein
MVGLALMNRRPETGSSASAGISDVRPATLFEWQQVFESDQRATFFHGPAWSQLWHAYTRGEVEPHPIAVEFDDGRKAILGITRAPTRVPGVGRHLLSPEGNCGGWVSAEALEPQQVKALADVVVRAGSCIWRAGPADEAVQALGLAGAREEVTHVIDLREGAARAHTRWEAEARRTAARARRRGARMIQGTTKQHWDAYRRLYRASVQRWDRPLFTYRDSLFTELSRLSERGVRLWLAEIDGETCAGAVLLMHHRYATYWHGATIPQLCPGATNLLQWELIDVLAEGGVQTYDLNGSGPLAGVARFKESLGAKPARVIAYERKHPLERTASAAKHLLTRRWS